jgi:hypothetical protein
MAIPTKIVHSDSGRKTVSSLSPDQSPLLQAAKLLIELYGEGAARYAAKRAKLLERKGDAVAASAWRRVTPVIQELQGLRDRDAAPN